MKCTATTTAGNDCQANAIRGSQPPRCAAHRTDGGPKPGAPPGNKNRLTHGYYSQPVKSLNSLDDIITDMLEKQSQLTSYIEEHANLADIPTTEMVTLLQLLGQNATRIGRLLRDQRALSGDSADGLLAAIGTAIDEIATELGLEGEL